MIRGRRESPEEHAASKPPSALPSDGGVEARVVSMLPWEIGSKYGLPNEAISGIFDDADGVDSPDTFKQNRLCGCLRGRPTGRPLGTRGRGRLHHADRNR